MLNNEQYYAIVNGKKIGPLTVKQLLDSGLTARHYVWTQGMEQWRQAGEVEAISQNFLSGSMPPPPPDAAFQQDAEKYNEENDGKVRLPRMNNHNTSADGSKKSNKSIRVGLWLLVISALFSVWLSVQGMFILAYLTDRYISIPCLIGGGVIIVAAIIYLYKYRKVCSRRHIYIAAGLLLAAIFPTIRLFYTYYNPFYKSFNSSPIIGLENRGRTIVSIYNTRGVEINRHDASAVNVYISDDRSMYILLTPNSADIYEYYGGSGASKVKSYNLEASVSDKDGFDLPYIAIKDIFGSRFREVSGKLDLNYIRIIDATKEVPVKSTGEKTAGSRATSDVSASGEQESRYSHESGTESYKPERHETMVPVQVWKQCMSCLGTGHCSWCYGQGVYSDYTGTHDCPNCIDGRCGICAGQGGHYETEYETRVDYY